MLFLAGEGSFTWTCDIARDYLNIICTQGHPEAALLPGIAHLVSLPKSGSVQTPTRLPEADPRASVASRNRVTAQR